ncbi:hypothetical protein VKT23_002969 [Stygiomarasmius scandens]|uniref:Peptidase A1 domain-containing protein n=1 Tax=Marasmiellus scandens TaxID=2682957 RepID=A0ABR1JY55_9AGAR
MALNPPTPESQSDGGVLHWLAPDTTAYQGDLTWKKLTSFDPTSVASTVSIGKDLLIGLDGWSFVSGKNSSVSQAGGNMIAAMDPFNSSLIFPQDAAHSIYSHVQDAQLLTVPEGTWSVPCDAKMQLTLTFDLLDVVLKEDTLIQKREDICIGTIIQWPDSSVSEYFLGSSFISAVYLIFSISGIDGSSIGIARRSVNSGNRFTGGAIAGVVLGGVAFVVAAIISIILINGKCKKRRRSRQSLSHLRPFTAGLGRDRGFIHDLPSPYSDQVGPTGDGGYVYYDSTPISPSYPLTPRTPPGLASTFGYRAYDSTTVLPITPQISSPTGATTDGISTTEQEVKSKRVLAYTVPVDDSTSQGHHTANHSRSDDNTNSTSRMNVRAGRRPVPLESLPPAYGHWEISDGQATSSGDVTASEQQSRRQRKEKKKRRVVMAP